MTTVSDTAVPVHRDGWFTRTEAWLDDKGKGAWIAAMVLGFIFFWPVGLALLAYMIWSKRMFAQKSCGARRNMKHHMKHDYMARRHGFRPTGNSAFDAYKADTLQRLMDEQEQFEAFLDRLRQAKDKSEFDEFMDERADAARSRMADVETDGSDDDAVVAKEPK